MHGLPSTFRDLTPAPDAPLPFTAPLAGSSPFRTDLPPDAPLDMPVQSLSVAPVRDAGRQAKVAWRPMVLAAATAGLTAAASWALFQALAADTVGFLDILILLVFTPLFAWTAFSFVSALAGFLAPRDSMDRLDAVDGAVRLASRTAILAPIYNEAPALLFARIEVMRRSLLDAGVGDFFDIFVISDTTDRAILGEEYARYRTLAASVAGAPPVYYRHRPLNVDRKAGNVADWVRRFGAAYDHMIILDADSLMEGRTLARLAGAMETQPDVGLIQTAPVVVNRHSLFARAEQFASRLYGPMLARGLAWWSGDESNYWGHNAIIRTRAFAATAGLPHLSGPRPFGGHIMSHDFVEAALMRRAGWAVRLAADLGGSYEESPPSLADLIARDRRWCQGNIQHLRVLPAAGLSWVSRLHLLRGVSAYLTAPLWLALLLMSALLPMKPHWGMSAEASADPTLPLATGFPMPLWAIMTASMAFLLAPKLLAYAAMLASPRERAGFGGAGKALGGVALETALSALLAPVLMANQIWALISILAGKDSGWVAQHREEEDINLETAANRHLGDTAVGIGLGVAAWGASPQTFLLMSPVIMGLVLCIPFAALTARRDLGVLARRAGLLVIPEEAEPPEVLRQFAEIQGRLEAEAAGNRPTAVSSPSRIRPLLRGDVAGPEGERLVRTA